MTSISRQTILLIGCLFLCLCTAISCKNKGDLQVTSRNFESAIEQQQNLTFTFNKDIFPDSLLNTWDSTAYIDFSPAVKGAFRWNSSSELVFSPMHGFAPGTAYTARLSKLLLRHSRKRYSISDEPITFHTAPLRVTATHLSWTRGKSMANVMVQMDMSFNYEVDLAQAAGRLKMSCNGNPLGITAASSGKGKVLSLQFMPVSDKDEETPLKIELQKGIPVPGSDYVSATDTSFTTGIPSRYNLAITSAMAQHTGTEGVITVNTSQPVLEKDLKSMIILQPSVPFEVTMNDAGFTITSSQFSATQTYELNISSRLEGIFGGKLKSEYSEQLTFGKLRPSISFINSKGMYLSSAGYKNLALNIVNVPALEVTVIKVYENNLEHFMRRDKSYRYHYDEDEDEGMEFEYYDTEDLGDTIYHKSCETAKLPRQNAAHVLHLDFQDRIRSYNGVYVISVRSKEQNWVQQSKILSVSDIGLIAREERDNIYVFANSIRTAKPLAGVNVSFISTNNQKLTTVTTGDDGVAVFRNIREQSPGFSVGMITAKMNDEFSFIFFNNQRIGTSRFDVGGRVPNETGLNAMIYPERNLYRPGETIHVSTIVRDERWNTQADVPVKIRLTMPNGKEFATMRKILNDEGSAEAAFTPPPTAMTGTYTVQVYTGNDVLLNTYEISVEEFMPDRMKVSLKLDKAEYRPGEKVVAAVQADNLFGTPAAGRNYQCELNLDKTTFTTDKFSDYDFTLRNEFKFATDTREGKTDDKGAASQAYELKDLPNGGMLSGNVMATVFDETGRPVHRYSRFTVYTQSVFAGIKCSEDYVSSRTPVSVGLVAVDKNGTPQAADARILLVKKEWHTVIQQSGSIYRYVSQSEERVINEARMKIAGTGTHYVINLPQSGDYELRVFINGSESYISKHLYAYGWGETQYTSFEVNNEGNVEIKTDKKSYNTGENVNVLFTTPFEGRMLVTLERDHVLKYYFVDTRNKSASLSFNAGDDHMPNVYITATLFRPMAGDDMPLTVAHGFRSVAVANKSCALPVSVNVTERTRSRSKQTISVKTAPGAYVTIAAVDEGILQVKNFESPDPYRHFFQKVALGVNSYDIYPWLLPEIRSTVSSTGGDGSDNSNMRVNPMFVNRVKNVSFWSGILQADGSGNVRYDIDIPQFSGDIRTMVVAYKGKSFGSADKHTKVADPIVISTALPRFLSPKDEVVMPISMSNTTNKAATAVVTVKVEGPLGIKGSATQTVQIPANREGRAVFNILANPAIGAGKVTVSVRAMNETFVNETEIGVRPPASLQKLTGSGFAGENATTPLTFGNAFIPSSFAGKLVVGKSPLTRFSKHIEDLVRYPYGCVEQTTSAAFPQLYYADLVKSLGGTTNSSLNPSYNVQQAVNKLQSMQQGDGGLSYWPGGDYESWWGSVYAAHFLFEAQKAGYDVNPGTLDRLYQYLKYRLFKKETISFWYDGDKHKVVAPEEVPYSLYVLALAGQPQQATMNYYKAHTALLTLDSKYMLAAAYAHAGQPSQAREVLPPAFSGEVPNRSFSGSFYSYIRDEALALNVLLDINPNDPQVPVMAKHLSEQLAKERYLSTQENVFSMLALGKIAKLTAKTNATATMLVKGKQVGTTTGDPLPLNLGPYAADVLNLQVRGKGGYYYWWEVSGITADGNFKEEDSYMRVRRTYFDRNGYELSSGSFKQNDLIVVRISVEGQYSQDIENVAITDMLPAGFEIENTRLSEMPAMKWVKQEATPDYVDIRDDRINMFTTVGRVRKDFYYMVRAVSPGTYHVGPVQADAMYDGNYHSYHGSGEIHIYEN